MNRDQIFISYSHADSEWLKRLQIMLAPLRRQRMLDVWEDTRIQAGQIWKEEIEKALERAYWMGSEWKQDADKNWRNPGFPQTDNHPVVGVSWNDTMLYVDWLSEQTGQYYRLPMEAEWKYALDGGTTR